MSNTTRRRRPRRVRATRAPFPTAPTWQRRWPDSTRSRPRLRALRPRARPDPRPDPREPGPREVVRRPPIACHPTSPSTPRRTVLLHDLLDDLELRDHLLEVRG